MVTIRPRRSGVLVAIALLVLFAAAATAVHQTDTQQQPQQPPQQQHQVQPDGTAPGQVQEDSRLRQHVTDYEFNIDVRPVQQDSMQSRQQFGQQYSGQQFSDQQAPNQSPPSPTMQGQHQNLPQQNQQQQPVQQPPFQQPSLQHQSSQQVQSQHPPQQTQQPSQRQQWQVTMDGNLWFRSGGYTVNTDAQILERYPAEIRFVVNAQSPQGPATQQITQRRVREQVIVDEGPYDATILVNVDGETVYRDQRSITVNSSQQPSNGSAQPGTGSGGTSGTNTSVSQLQSQIAQLEQQVARLEQQLAQLQQLLIAQQTGSDTGPSAGQQSLTPSQPDAQSSTVTGGNQDTTSDLQPSSRPQMVTGQQGANRRQASVSAYRPAQPKQPVSRIDTSSSGY